MKTSKSLGDTGHMGVGCEGAGPAATGDTEGGGADEEREPGEGGGGVAEQRWGAEADGAGVWEDGAAVAVGGLGAGDVEMGGLRFTCSYTAGGERGDGAAEGQRMCATGLGCVGRQLEAGAADEGGGAEGAWQDQRTCMGCGHEARSARGLAQGQVGATHVLWDGVEADAADRERTAAVPAGSGARQRRKR